MNIYTLETVTNDYYEFVDLKATSVSIRVIIDEMKRLENPKCTRDCYNVSIYDRYRVSIYDGFTGKLLRNADVSKKDVPTITKESINFEEIK